MRQRTALPQARAQSATSQYSGAQNSRNFSGEISMLVL
jgi:hypothetical protein